MYNELSKTLLTILAILLVAIIVGILGYLGCDTPYSGHLGPADFNGWIESEEDGFVCIWNGFDRICIQSVAGPPGKDGKDGKDGATLIAVHKVSVTEIVEKIINNVVVQEYIKYVPFKVVVDRVIIEYVDREVPFEVFVDRTVEIIKEVFVEVEKIVKVPGETIYIEVAGEAVYIDVPGEKEIIYVDVPGEKEIIYVDVPGETVYIQVPGETVYINVPTPEIAQSVTQDATYTEEGFDNPPGGYHAHEFTHTHDGVEHTHQVIHPDGEADDFEREHDGYDGLTHD